MRAWDDADGCGSEPLEFMTPTKRTPKPLLHFKMLIRTARGNKYRYYRHRSYKQAMQQAENRGDCQEVLRAVEITAEQYEIGLATSDQKQRFMSAAPAVWRNQTSSARD